MGPNWRKAFEKVWDDVSIPPIPTQSLPLDIICQEAVRNIHALTHKQRRGKTTNKKDRTMKTITYSIITTAIALASLTGNAYFINNAMNAADALTECARRENVFQCEFEAVPTEEPKVVYKTAELLPPPELN